MDIVARLIKQLASEDETVRVQAGEFLIQMGSAAVRPLIEALQNPHYPARPLIASTLGQIGDRRAVEPLIHALKDQDKLVRYHAALALGKLKDQRAIRPLIHSLFDEMPPIGSDPFTSDLLTIRAAAAQSLGELKAVEAVPALKVLLKDENRSVRRAVIQALGQIGSEKAIAALREAVWREEDEALVELIIRTLSRYPSPQNFETLRQVSETHPEERFRQIARTYLQKMEALPVSEPTQPQKHPSRRCHPLWLLGGAVLTILLTGLIRLGWKQNRNVTVAVAGAAAVMAFGLWKYRTKVRRDQLGTSDASFQSPVSSRQKGAV